MVIAELPGIGQEDLSVELHEDILSINAERGNKKYEKEVLLPASFKPEQMTQNCRNGMLEIKFQR
jgi:HSP20 family protein